MKINNGTGDLKIFNSCRSIQINSAINVIDSFGKQIPAASPKKLNDLAALFAKERPRA